MTQQTAFHAGIETPDMVMEGVLWQEADAVIVSDFIAQRLPEEVIGTIKTRQRNNQQRFHAVAMSAHEIWSKMRRMPGFPWADIATA